MTKDEHFKLMLNDPRAALKNAHWKCRICGAFRADKDISVAQHKSDAYETTLNVRYCNDNPDCEKTAHKKGLAFLRDMHNRRMKIIHRPWYKRIIDKLLGRVIYD